jgi:hypothetical protein
MAPKAATLISGSAVIHHRFQGRNSFRPHVIPADSLFLPRSIARKNGNHLPRSKCPKKLSRPWRSDDRPAPQKIRKDFLPPKYQPNPQI